LNESVQAHREERTERARQLVDAIERKHQQASLSAAQRGVASTGSL
jgi:hypothetical protein